MLRIRPKKISWESAVYNQLMIERVFQVQRWTFVSEWLILETLT
jgi:hypothetical protein